MIFTKILMPIFFLASATALAFGGVINHPSVTKTFTNSDCQSTDSCGLTEFKIRSNEFTATFVNGPSSHGTNIIMSYKTEKVEELENYAVVNFIKGCKFNSFKNPEGKIQKWFGTGRQFFGKPSRFQHREWAVDSIDTDPMYHNYTPENRHAYYKWKKNGADISYIRQRPVKPELFVTDLPGTATLSEIGIATNISLKFKTCIFKTSDIPVHTSPDNVHFAEPIKCLDWGSSYIYNHKLKKFETTSEIDLFCEPLI